MAVLANLAAARSAQNNNQARGGNNRRNNEQRDPTQVWMNIGYDVDGKFVNLPLGLGIDTMEPVRISGQDADWLNLSHARNDLLKEIQEAAAELEPGEEMELPLVVKIRRINTSVEVNSESNPLSMKNAGLSMKKVAATE